MHCVSSPDSTSRCFLLAPSARDAVGFVCLAISDIVPRVPPNRYSKDRHPHDFYPTPSLCSRPLVEWLAANTSLDASDPWLDPAAGDGDLIATFRERWPGGFWYGIEIDRSHRRSLEAVANRILLADALEAEWPAANIAANPPFKLLDRFWSRMAEHRRTHGVWGACFTPVGYWQAQRRVHLVRPDVLLALAYRPRGFGNIRTGPFQDYVWAVLRPTPARETVWTRVERPALTLVSPPPSRGARSQTRG